MSDDTIRWTATVFYRTDSGFVDVTHDLSELEDLHDRVEAGPCWDTIVQIVIARINPVYPGLTVEEAAEL